MSQNLKEDFTYIYRLFIIKMLTLITKFKLTSFRNITWSLLSGLAFVGSLNLFLYFVLHGMQIGWLTPFLNNNTKEKKNCIFSPYILFYVKCN